MTSPEISQKKTAVTNLTALWAFSEGFLGGILNALKIPFKGLFLGSISVIMISLIAANSEKRGVILKSGIIVMIVKAILSPYSSVPAYFAVFMQTILGELFFLNKKFFTISSVLLGIITSILSSVQRIIVLTILFGNAFWETVDQFTGYVYSEITGSKDLPADFKLSKWLIGIYIGIHAIVGFLVGLYAARLSKKSGITNERQQKILEEVIRKSETKHAELPSGKKRKSFFKITGIIIYIFLIVVLILSYTSAGQFFDKGSVWLMIIRSVAITILWFRIISPVLGKFIRKKLLKSQGKYSEDIKGIMNIFPNIKSILFYSWKYAEGKGLRKLSGFITLTLSVLMYRDL